MKRYLMLALLLAVSAAQANDLNWQNNPNNWKNSDLNYANSSMKWDNSPYNWKNSDLNYNQRNGIYDNAGDQIGYKTYQPNTGVTNYFDDDGYRLGYSDE